MPQALSISPSNRSIIRKEQILQSPAGVIALPLAGAEPLAAGRGLAWCRFSIPGTRKCH